ncbi:hypothetical protein BJY04DRAFT_220781 [Aspergillus karnatakaensis]|uniref:DUF1593 domain-containing protein n=1 Tax=Aspergillus karnatakaensis TaxID=1810916 RepID=UPI003CCD7762
MDMAPPNTTKGERDSLISYQFKPRVFILTDITNEPDDAQSFCRYLTYANQFRTEGIVAVTSVWLRDQVAPEKLHEIIDAYEKVVDNLNAHSHPASPYPSAEELRALVASGPEVYGLAAVGDDIPLSAGSQLLLDRLVSSQTDSIDPIWVLVWGGVNVVAQVLHKIQSEPNAAALRANLRVYTISDQDDSGPWIRQQWPDLFYICSTHGWNQYGTAAWRGISGDFAPNGFADRGGPDPSTITAEWIRENIQLGPLGGKYPNVKFIMEGDTPTFLYLIQNGLGVPEESH